MDSAQLNLTTKILGFGRFLFVDLHGPYIDSSLLKAMEDAGAQRANPQRLRKGELADDDVARSVVLVRLEGSVTDPLLAYERRLRAAIEECAEPWLELRTGRPGMVAPAPGHPRRAVGLAQHVAKRGL